MDVLGFEVELGPTSPPGEDGVISAIGAISHEKFKNRWVEETAEKRASHARGEREGGSGSRAWHRGRLRGLDPEILERGVVACGRSHTTARCGCDDLRIVDLGCGRWIPCARCGARRAHAYSERAREAVLWHLARLGRRAAVYLITLTLPHEKVSGRAEELLDLAWRRMMRHAPPWRDPCLAVAEWTPGRDLLGHPHLHVVVVSRYLDYWAIGERWRAAVVAVGGRRPGAHGVDITMRPGGSGRRCSQSVGCGCAPCAASRYVASYVSKTATQRYAPEEWARLCGYFATRRTVRASVATARRPGWWVPIDKRCPCCEQRWIGHQTESGSTPARRLWTLRTEVLHPGRWDWWAERDPVAEVRDALRSDAVDVDGDWGEWMARPLPEDQMPPLPSEAEQREHLTSRRAKHAALEPWEGLPSGYETWEEYYAATRAAALGRLRERELAVIGSEQA